MADEKKAIPSPEVISKWYTYLIGVIVCSSLVAVLIMVFNAAFIPNPITDLASIVIGLIVFRIGFIVIPVGDQGVMLFLGEQINSYVLETGYCWILPVFMKVDSIRVQQQRTDIEAVIEVIKSKKNPKPEEDGSIASVNSEMHTTTMVLWKVVNPVTMLLQNKGEKDVEQKLRSYTESQLREIAANGLSKRAQENESKKELDPQIGTATDPSSQWVGLTDIEFIRLKDAIKDQIQDNFKGDAANAELSTWGVEIQQIILTKIERANKGTEDASEAARQAEYKQNADKVSQENLSRRSKEIEDHGFTAKEAYDRALMEFGHVEGIKILGDASGPVPDIVKAAALVQRSYRGERKTYPSSAT